MPDAATLQHDATTPLPNTAHVFRSTMLRPAYAAGASYHANISSQLDKFPFCRTQGDILTHVSALEHAAGAQDETTWEIQTMVKLGEPLGHVCSALELLRDAADSTVVVDQASVSAKLTF